MNEIVFGIIGLLLFVFIASVIVFLVLKNTGEVHPDKDALFGEANIALKELREYYYHLGNNDATRDIDKALDILKKLEKRAVYD